MRKALPALVLLFALSGCYHATVQTGLAPSTNEVEDNWAHSFLYGLVPPDEMNVTEECPYGVAQVETEHSFLNQLAAGLTGWLYTPMTIRVVCATP